MLKKIPGYAPTADRSAGASQKRAEAPRKGPFGPYRTGPLPNILIS